MDTLLFQATPLQDSDYLEVDYYLQEQAQKLSPEVKTIIAQAFRLAKRRNPTSTLPSRPESTLEIVEPL